MGHQRNCSPFEIRVHPLCTPNRDITLPLSTFMRTMTVGTVRRRITVTIITAEMV